MSQPNARAVPYTWRTWKARQAVLSGVDRDKIKSDTGLKEIVTCLNELYDKDKSQSAFAAYDDFTNFRRSKNASIQDYIVEFNLKYNKIKTYDMTLPDAVIAYYLLKCANLTEEQTNLCKATCTDLTYKSMRTQIEKVTSNISSDSKGATGNEESVNVTPQFYTFDEDEEFPCDYEASYEEDEEQHDTYYGQVPFRPRENNAYSTVGLLCCWYGLF